LAIPVNDVQFVVSRLLGPGQLRLGWIGAHVQPVTADIATAVGLPVAAGSIVTNVENDSPAAHAGLIDGDIVLKVSGEAVTGPRSLNREITGSTIGGVAELEVWRDGAQKIVAVMIEESQADRTASESAQSPSGEAVGVDRRDLGLVLGSITESVRAKLGMRPQQAGVLIEDVVAHSAAADRGITAGSLLVSVDGHPVTLADVQPRIDAARSANHHFVLMLVEDQQGLQWVALPLDAP
jgi:serine protease Do